MAKNGLGIVLVFVLLFSITYGLLANLAAANVAPFFDRQYLPELTIKSDGSISVPQSSDLINRNGNVYTLTADIENYSVEIYCSNIVFDGAGHTINAISGFDNSGLRVLQGTNVTVKNLEIIGEKQTSLFLSSSNCSIINVKTQNDIHDNGEFNTITENDIKKLILWSGGSNFISKCNISGLYISGRSGSNTFVMNAFLINIIEEESFTVNSANFWDNGSVGNYWSNYTVKYPNASEVNNTRIGDTPYVINQNNIDHYPLIPYGTKKDYGSKQEHETQPSFTPFITGVSIVTAIGITSTLIYYLKHRKS